MLKITRKEMNHLCILGHQCYKTKAMPAFCGKYEIIKLRVYTADAIHHEHHQQLFLVSLLQECMHVTTAHNKSKVESP